MLVTVTILNGLKLYKIINVQSNKKVIIKKIISASYQLLYRNLCAQINTSTKNIEWRMSTPSTYRTSNTQTKPKENKIEKLEEMKERRKKNIFIFIYNLCANFTSPVSVIFERFI